MWAKLLNTLGIRRYTETLAGVNAPTRVRLRGEIASQNDRESPVTEMRAALFLYGLGQRYTVSNHRDRRETVVTQSLGHSLDRGDLLLKFDEGHVVCPADVPLVVSFEGDGFMSLPSFRGDLPPGIAHLMAQHERGEVIYAEQTLRQGDAIELFAWVEPAKLPDLPMAPSGYRDVSSSNGWRVVDRPKQPAMVKDRTLAEMGL